MYDESVASKPVKESELFSALNRIDKKIETLRGILNVVICDVPNVDSKETVSTTELNGRIGSIEGKISRLIDTIQL